MRNKTPYQEFIDADTEEASSIEFVVQDRIDKSFIKIMFDERESIHQDFGEVGLFVFYQRLNKVLGDCVDIENIKIGELINKD